MLINCVNVDIGKVIETKGDEIFVGDSSFATNIYDKLFQSCKGPMLILERSADTTGWSREEKLILLRVIKDGIRILKQIIPI